MTETSQRLRSKPVNTTLTYWLLIQGVWLLSLCLHLREISGSSLSERKLPQKEHYEHVDAHNVVKYSLGLQNHEM